MIIVAGKIVVRAEDRDEFVARSAPAVKHARGTGGCLDYDGGCRRWHRLNVFEAWTSRAAPLAFRSDGPGAELRALIVRAEISEFDVGDR